MPCWLNRKTKLYVLPSNQDSLYTQLHRTQVKVSCRCPGSGINYLCRHSVWKYGNQRWRENIHFEKKASGQFAAQSPFVAS